MRNQNSKFIKRKHAARMRATWKGFTNERKPWTNLERAKLFELRYAGIAPGTISETLKRTLEAVSAEKSRLLENADGRFDEFLKWVRKHKWKIVRKRDHFHRDENEDLLVLVQHEEDRAYKVMRGRIPTRAEIAEVMGRTEDSVNLQIRALHKPKRSGILEAIAQLKKRKMTKAGRLYRQAEQILSE